MMNAESRRTAFIVLTMVLLVILCTVSAFLAPGWKSLAAIVFFFLLLDLIYLIVYRDRVLLHWILFGLAAGWIELIADWYLIAETRTLDYPPKEWIIWKSPAYMPFDWAMVLIQLGVVGTWLRNRRGLLWGTVLTGLIGGIFIPFYECLANRADWWSYHDTPMFWHVPYYIVLAEFLLSVPLVLMDHLVEGRSLAYSVLLGVVEGFAILVAAVFAYWLVGPCQGAVIQLPC
jgi:hypothetical protein